MYNTILQCAPYSKLFFRVNTMNLCFKSSWYFSLTLTDLLSIRQCCWWCYLANTSQPSKRKPVINWPFKTLVQDLIFRITDLYEELMSALKKYLKQSIKIQNTLLSLFYRIFGPFFLKQIILAQRAAYTGIRSGKLFSHPTRVPVHCFYSLYFYFRSLLN